MFFFLRGVSSCWIGSAEAFVWWWVCDIEANLKFCIMSLMHPRILKNALHIGTSRWNWRASGLMPNALPDGSEKCVFDIDVPASDGYESRLSVPSL